MIFETSVEEVKAGDASNDVRDISRPIIGPRSACGVRGETAVPLDVSVCGPTVSA